MGELFEKFKNERFPSWMRQIKTDYPLPPISVANDNEKKIYESEDKDISGFYLSAPCNLTAINLIKPRYPEGKITKRAGSKYPEKTNYGLSPAFSALTDAKLIKKFPHAPKNEDLITPINRLLQADLSVNVVNFATVLMGRDLQDLLNRPVKLKLPVRLKRKLRRDKAKYKQVRKWLDDAENAVNEALFGGRGDEL